MEDLNFNIETVNLDSELDFETFEKSSKVECYPLKNIEFEQVNQTDARKKEDGNVVNNLLNLFNPINWEILKGHFDITTDEIKERLTKILRNIYTKESIFQNINSFIVNTKNTSSNFSFNNFGLKNYGNNQIDQWENGFELFYCKNLDQIRKSDLYGPFWLNVTLSIIIGIYSTLLPHIKSRYIVNPDITRLTFSFSYIFSSLLIICLFTYGTLLYCSEYLPLTLLLTIYGYSTITYFPGILLIIIFNQNLLNWLFLCISSFFSMMFLYNSLIINGNKNHSHLVVFSCIILPNVIYLILLKLLFF